MTLAGVARALVTSAGIVAGVVAVLWLLVRATEARLAFFPFRGEDFTPERFGVPFEGLTVRTADGETLRAWWLPHQAARAQVVYFHGNGGNLSLWSPVLVDLHQHGLSVLAVDYRGYGLSSGRPSERGLYRDVDATLALLDDPRRHARVPLVYWGRSLGTAVAAYAATRRAPDGVVLESGFPDVQALLRHMPVLWALSWFSSYRFPAAQWMRGVRAPVLVIHGTEDTIVPFEAGERLFAQIDGAKRFHAVPGGDHNDPAPRRPDEYWRAVDEFLAGLRPAAPPR